MRAGTLLAVVAVLMAQPAMSDIVRRSSIPEPLLGRWVADGEDCNSKTGLVIAATKYVDAGAECTIRAISQTAGQRGTVYSTRAQCPASAKTLIILLKDASHITAGSNFSNLKTLQKCEN
jgi:hypothetical protein